MKKFLFLLLTATLIATACKTTPKTPTPEDLAKQAVEIAPSSLGSPPYPSLREIGRVAKLVGHSLGSHAVI